jgi:CheY-like chemotaxis protein
MTKPKVLIVDDFPDNIFLLEEIVASLGYEPVAVQNGEEAVNEVRDNDYKVVFMDIEMPIMNGFEASEEIRNELPAPKNETLIIAISAHSYDFFEEKMEKTGINDYISKPYTFNKIIKILEKYGITAS